MEKKSFFTYLVILAFGFLSIYNHLSLRELRNSNANNEGLEVNHRTRRDVSDDDWSKIFDVDRLTNLIQEQANRTFQKEIKSVLDTLILNFPVDPLCKSIAKKCKTGCSEQRKIVVDDDVKIINTKCARGPRGPPGPRGKAGPRGPSGERGLGLRPPKLVYKSLMKTSNLTDDVILECTFFGNPIPQVVWESEATKTQVTSSIDIEQSHIKSQMKIFNVTWNDRGKVTCKAQSLLGRDESSGQLNVFSPPIISLESGPLFVYKGMNFEFPECKVRSYPTASIKWKRMIWPLPAGRYSTNGGFLNISRVKYEDEDYYKCEAENSLGQSSSMIQLKIKPLELFDKPRVTIEAFDWVNLTCSAYGNPATMSGSITTTNNEQLDDVEVIRSENVFTVRTSVNESATYKCAITNDETTVQAFTIVDIFSLNSNLIPYPQNEAYELLGSWLSETSSVGKYELCWSSIKHGNGIFFNRCSGKPKTITIARLRYQRSRIYGGFSDVAWIKPYNRYAYPHISTGYSSSRHSFIFDLTNKTKYDVLNHSTATCRKTYGPCFGQSEFWFSCCSMTMYLNKGNSYSYNGSSVSGSQVDVEVFYKVN